LHLFVLRDVVAIRISQSSIDRESRSPENTDISMSNFIMRSLVTYEIRDLHTLSIIRDFMNKYMEHFCHELYTYANSSFDIFDYNGCVEYATRKHYSGLIVK